MARAYVGLGSNLGDAEANVRAAIERLGCLGTLRATSSLYRSAPWGRRDQPAFVNAAVALDTELDPHALLAELKRAERELGREVGERWGPRLIDLDILDYEGRTLEGVELTVPHRHLAQRAFALVPLTEIAPQYRALLARLDPEARAEVVKLAPPTG